MEEAFLAVEHKTVYAQYKSVKSLGGYLIYCERDEIDNAYLIGDVFDIMQELDGKGILPKYSKSDDAKKCETLMESIAPKYNPDKFKHYHLKKIFPWYRILVQSLKDFKNMENNGR